MRYYFKTNDSGLIVGKFSALNPIENDANFKEISSDQFNNLFLQGKDYVYSDGKIVEIEKEQTVEIDPIYATIIGVKLQLDLLIELQADTLGGAI
jgi:hypothetical protein